MAQSKNTFLETVSRWKEHRVADLILPQSEPRLIEHTAVVLEEVKNENESILYGLKYFEYLIIVKIVECLFYKN